MEVRRGGMEKDMEKKEEINREVKRKRGERKRRRRKTWKNMKIEERREC